MNPDTRTLIRVVIDDKAQVERRKYIDGEQS